VFDKVFTAECVASAGMLFSVTEEVDASAADMPDLIRPTDRVAEIPNFLTPGH